MNRNVFTFCETKCICDFYCTNSSRAFRHSSHWLDRTACREHRARAEPQRSGMRQQVYLMFAHLIILQTVIQIFPRTCPQPPLKGDLLAIAERQCAITLEHRTMVPENGPQSS